MEINVLDAQVIDNLDSAFHTVARLDNDDFAFGLPSVSVWTMKTSCQFSGHGKTVFQILGE